MNFAASVLPAVANAALALFPIPPVYSRALSAAQVAANQGNYAASWHLNRRIASATNTDQLASSPTRATTSPLHTFGLLARVRMAKQVVAGQAPASRGKVIADMAGQPADVWHRVATAALSHLDMLYAAGRLTSPSKEELDLAWETLALAFDPAIQQRAGAPLVESDSLMRELLSGPFVASLTRAPASPSLELDDKASAATTPAATAPAATGPTHLADRFAEDTRLEEATPLVRKSQDRQRVLILVDGKDAFIKAARVRWENKAGVEVRFHQVEKYDWNLRETLRLRMTGQPTPIPAFLAADLAWADVVMVEWGAAAAARISGMNFKGKLVVRIHRFEAFTVMPLLFNLPGIDHIVFEVEAVREAWQRAVGAAATTVDAPVIPLECELRRFELPKKGNWRHTLALVGCSSNVKDPQWTLDLLALLRERDERWRLLMVGDVLSSTITDSPEELRYVERVKAALAAPDCGVEQLGFRTDIPEVLRSVGVIVSSSLVEGTHAAVLEGAASGCLPVVRDWPHVAAIGGARANFPGHWIVSTPQDAAERILAWDQELDLTARDYVVERWDVSKAGPLLDSLVLDDVAARP